MDNDMITAAAVEEQGTVPDTTLDLLFARSCDLAARVIRGELAFLDAVDMAYSAADIAGLTSRIGDDAVQQILAAAFISVPRRQGLVGVAA